MNNLQYVLVMGLVLTASPAVSQPEVSQVERRIHAGQAARATLSDITSIEPFLDGYAAAAMADQYPPGMMVAVATRDQVFVKAYGVANVETGEKATPETLFRIASISKTFVWIAATMLADEGKLDLRADVNSYLKNVRIKEKFGKPVTMNDLMAHRGGFEDTLGDFFQSDKGRTFEEALVATMPARVAPPGERTSYSNWGTNLAAQVITDIAGVPFDEFVSTRILAPVGMVSTTQHDPARISAAAQNLAALDARLAAPHKLDAGMPVVMRDDALEPLHAAGAVALDANDAARWMQFLLNNGVVKGDRLLSPEAFTLMRLRAFRDRTGAPDMAHGFMETTIAGATAFGHGGTLSGYIADMTIMPSLGVGVFVVVNGAERPRLPDLVSRAVIEQFAGEYSFPGRWSVIADEKMKKAATTAAGEYLGNRRSWTKFEKLASVGSDIKIAAKDDGSLVMTAGGNEKRYYPLSEDIWTDRSRDRLFVYRNADGSVKRIAYGMGTDTAEPVAFFTSSTGFSVALGFVVAFSVFAFLGAWRRQGRDVETTSTGRWLAAGHAFVALLWLAFVGAIIWAIVGIGDKDLADLQEMGWPPTPVLAAQIIAHVAALGALAAIAGVVPVLARSGWSIWRKGHYVLFAAVGAFALYELWVWRVILSANSGG